LDRYPNSSRAGLRGLLEGWLPALNEHFGSAVNKEHNERIKQIIGRMARQVIENNGY